MGGFTQKGPGERGSDVTDISLVAVDLDDTLLTSAHVLAPRGARLLRQAAGAGVRVVLATTRNPDTTRPFCDELEINDPIICSNGAQVWGSPRGPIWAIHHIPREAALAIAQMADEYDFELSTTIGSTTYLRQRPGQPLGPLTPHITVVPANADAIVGDPIRILLKGPEALDRIIQLCHSRFIGQCRTDVHYERDGTPRLMCVLPPGADKGTALSLVLDRLGIQRQRSLAIGDNLNDLPMFGVAGTSVAVGNALEQVKRRASAVAPSDDEEGVAWALERFVLTGERSMGG
jgi:Cof subfamily protein (haloacid dehalogenase superfamily)